MTETKGDLYFQPVNFIQEGNGGNGNGNGGNGNGNGNGGGEFYGGGGAGGPPAWGYNPHWHQPAQQQPQVFYTAIGFKEFNTTLLIFFLYSMFKMLAEVSTLKI